MPSSLALGCLPTASAMDSSRKRFTPGNLDRVHRRTSSFHVVLHATAEHTVDADDDFVTRFHQVDDDRFHPSHAGAGDRKGQRHCWSERLHAASGRSDPCTRCTADRDAPASMRRGHAECAAAPCSARDPSRFVHEDSAVEEQSWIAVSENECEWRKWAFRPIQARIMPKVAATRM